MPRSRLKLRGECFRKRYTPADLLHKAGYRVSPTNSCTKPITHEQNPGTERAGRRCLHMLQGSQAVPPLPLLPLACAHVK